MYLPSFPNLMSDIEAIISVKNDLEPAGSCSSNLHKRSLVWGHHHEDISSVIGRNCEIKK